MPITVESVCNSSLILGYALVDG